MTRSAPSGTVWVHTGDSDTVALLSRQGHVLDGSPEAMAADFEATPPQRPPDGALSDWTAAGDLARTMGAINDRAYGYGSDWFSRALTILPDGAVHIYVVNQDGAAVGCCAAIDTGSNTEVQMVAVVPGAARACRAS